MKNPPKSLVYTIPVMAMAVAGLPLHSNERRDLEDTLTSSIEQASFPLDQAGKDALAATQVLYAGDIEVETEHQQLPKDDDDSQFHGASTAAGDSTAYGESEPFVNSATAGEPKKPKLKPRKFWSTKKKVGVTAAAGVFLAGAAGIAGFFGGRHSKSSNPNGSVAVSPISSDPIEAAVLSSVSSSPIQAIAPPQGNGHEHRFGGNGLESGCPTCHKVVDAFRDANIMALTPHTHGRK